MILSVVETNFLDLNTSFLYIFLKADISKMSIKSYNNKNNTLYTSHFVLIFLCSIIYLFAAINF